MRRRLLLPALVLLVTAILLLPDADLERLEQRAASRLLERHADPLGLFVRGLGPERPTVRLRPAAGASGDAEGGHRRAFEAALAGAGARFSDDSPLVVEFGVERGDTGVSIRVSARDAAAAEVATLGPLGPEPLRDRSALLPPLVAIGLAVLWRRTVPALLAGVLIGAVLLRLSAGGAALPAVARGLLDVPLVHLWKELSSTFRVEVIGFIVALMGMVGVMIRTGGVRGLVELVLRFAGSVRTTLATSFGMGLLLFFDDYSNCLIVGSTMRPLTDRLRVSREKLAFVVDSTAAPVAGVSLLSTWVAFEISLFSAQLPAAGIGTDPYAVFLMSLPYRFYCWFTLLLVLLVIVSGRDFGPMLAAERRARATGELVRRDGTPLVSDAFTALEPSPLALPRAHRALLPVATVVLVTVLETLRRGGGLAGGAGSKSLLDVLSDGGGAGPLFVGATCGLAVAVALGARTLPARELGRAALSSTRALSFAVAILFSAWMIGSICEELGTADYLIALTAGSLPPELLPLLLFGAACLVSFATGTSWGTMSILLPNVVGLAAAVGAEAPIGSLGMVLLCIGSVLEGSIFGDHCSPISDTTVLSSVASASDHLDHVRTQAPYALLAAGAALGVGYLPNVLLPAWPVALSLLLAGLVFLAALYGFGGQAEPPPAEASRGARSDPTFAGGVKGPNR